MLDIITRNAAGVEQKWLDELSNAVKDPQILLNQLNIDLVLPPSAQVAKQNFAMRVPQSFIARMEQGNPNDPLLRQVLPLDCELENVEGFGVDPLAEQQNATPSLLHKYKNRVLLIVKSGCAINCRYCFRRHFPYSANPSGKRVWQQHLDYIKAHPEIDEVIFSGGDPLMAKDDELAWLITRLEAIEHVKRLRIHTRLATALPARINRTLCSLLRATRLAVVLITHVNHANEIDSHVQAAMQMLKDANVVLLNQSVLLRGVNDDAATLKTLSLALFTAGILPYYLHLLDKVAGAAHFWVSDDSARELMATLLASTSGYLVPRLTREIAGKASKTPIDLYLGAD